MSNHTISPTPNPSTSPASTLYDRLGGRQRIEAIVRDMYGRLLADPLLQPFFRDIDLDWLVASQAAFVSQALGGPREYRGKSMKHAHAGARIEPQHFDRFTGHLGAALTSASVPEALQQEIFGAFAALRKVIINAEAGDA